MKKLKRLLSFVLFALLVLPCVLGLEQQPGTNINTTIYEAELTLQQGEMLLSTYRPLLIQQSQPMTNSSENLASPQTAPTTSESSSPELSDLLNQGSNLFDLLDNQLAELQAQLNNSEKTMTSLVQALEQAKATIKTLSDSLNLAKGWADQMGDRLQESNEFLAQEIEYSAGLEHEIATLKRNKPLTGFAIGGVTFGVGTPLIIEGINKDNKTMLWTGVGTIGIGALVFSIGHYVFHWF